MFTTGAPQMPYQKPFLHAWSLNEGGSFRKDERKDFLIELII
jgi:hypothetical protein